MDLIRQRTPPQRLGFRSEADTLIVGEPEPPRSELLAQDAILLLQIVDDVALLLVYPAGQRDQQEPYRMPERNHGGRVSEPRPARALSHRDFDSSCWTLRASHWCVLGIEKKGASPYQLPV